MGVMKKLAILLALLLLPVFALGQTGAYSGHTFVGGVPATTSGMNSSNYLDGIIPGASITVYLTGTTTKATIYADGSNTPLSNPFFSNLAPGTNPGGFIFWAAQNQGLDIQAQGGMGNASCTTSPLCYSTATTLQVDVYPNSSMNSSILPGCLGANTVANGCTGATTAAGANLSITGVTQTGTLGTSSQVSTFSGTVAAAAMVPTNSPFVDIRAFGAVMDNATDIGPAIQAAVNSFGYLPGHSPIILLPCTGDNGAGGGCYWDNPSTLSVLNGYVYKVLLQGTLRVGSTLIAPYELQMYGNAAGAGVQFQNGLPGAVTGPQVYGTVGTAITSTNTPVTITPTFTGGSPTNGNNLAHLPIGSALTIAGTASVSATAVRTAPGNGLGEVVYTLATYTRFVPDEIATVTGCADTSFNGVNIAIDAVDYGAQTVTTWQSDVTPGSTSGCTITSLNGDSRESARILCSNGVAGTFNGTTYNQCSTGQVTIVPKFTHSASDQWGEVAAGPAFNTFNPQVWDSISIYNCVGDCFWAEGSTNLYMRGMGVMPSASFTAGSMHFSNGYVVQIHNSSIVGSNLGQTAPPCIAGGCVQPSYPYVLDLDADASGLFYGSSNVAGGDFTIDDQSVIYGGVLAPLEGLPRFTNTIFEEVPGAAVTIDNRTGASTNCLVIEHSFSQDSVNDLPFYYVSYSDPENPEGCLELNNVSTVASSLLTNTYFNGQLLTKNLVGPFASYPYDLTAPAPTYLEGGVIKSEIEGSGAGFGPSTLPFGSLPITESVASWTSACASSGPNCTITSVVGPDGPNGKMAAAEFDTTASTGTYNMIGTWTGATYPGDHFIYGLWGRPGAKRSAMYGNRADANNGFGLFSSGSDVFAGDGNAAAHVAYPTAFGPNLGYNGWAPQVAIASVVTGQSTSHNITFGVTPGIGSGTQTYGAGNGNQFAQPFWTFIPGPNNPACAAAGTCNLTIDQIEEARQDQYHGCVPPGVAAGQTATCEATNDGGITTASVTVSGAPAGSYVKADGTGYGTPSSGASGAAGGVLSGTYPNPGLSASPQAIPNGWTATTQTTGDNTAKVATDAFVNASIGGGGSMTWPSGGAGIPNYNGSSAWGTSYSAGNQIPASFIPTLNQSTTGSAGSVANALTMNSSGGGATSGTTFDGSAARTISYNTIGASPLAGSTSLTTLGTIGTGTWQGTLIGSAYGGTGVSNTATLTLGTSNQNWATLGTGIVKNTTTTGAISVAAGSDIITPLQALSGCNTPTYVLSPQASDCVAPSATSIIFPQTVSGTTTSGGIPYFSNTTTLTSSGILNTNILVKGGGAGGAPTNSLFTDNGTTATYSGTGGITASAGPLTAGNPSGGVGSSLFLTQEGTVPSGLSTAGEDNCYADSTQHGLLCNFNAGTTLPLVQGPGSETTGHLATWSGTNGGKLVDGGAVPTGTLTSVNTLTGPAVVIEAATAGQVAISGGNAAALTGSPDLTYSTHTFSATANTIFDLSAATGTAALKVPQTTTNTATAAGAIDFDTTNKNFHGYVNGADSMFLNIAAAPTNNHILIAAVATGNTLAADAGFVYTAYPAADIAAGALANGMTATTQSQLDGSTKLATTLYTDTAVSNAVAGVNPAVAVLAASTATITGTYAQVGGGVGDTFTVTATGAFTLDGIAINTIGQRVLLKNQTSANQNGIYTATIVGTTGVSAVFTRALDYDMPSDVNNTGSIPVQSGTVNTTTSWLLTSQVTSIGSSGSSLTYAQFSLAPSTIVTSAASLTNNALMTGAGGQGSQTVTTGSGVLTALGVNTGTAGAFVVNGGALGTPSGGTLTNATGLPISGVTGWGTGVATALADAVNATGGFLTYPLAGSSMSNNTVTATQLAAQYSKGACTEVWGGTNTANALQSGDDAIANNTCYNDSGVTRTITAVKCRSDAASNTTTVNPTFGSAGTGTTVLSGALTCGNSYAYSSTGTVSNASWTTGTGIDPAMSGTLTGTSIAMLVEYTF